MIKYINSIKYPVLLLILIMVVFNTACKKDNKCEAGSGGALTLIAKLKHHAVIIPNDSLRPDTVWIRYNAQDWSSAPSGADAMLVGEFPEDHIHISGLKCGDYYLYASGWDASISQIVTGGRAFSTENSDGELEVDIAVTE